MQIHRYSTQDQLANNIQINLTKINYKLATVMCNCNCKWGLIGVLSNCQGPIYKRHEENKRKIGQERSSMQQADYHRHRPTP